VSLSPSLDRPMEPNPFSRDILADFALAPPKGTAVVLHGAAEKELLSRLGEARDTEQGQGLLLLLCAQRAGSGKTHLLARLRAQSGVGRAFLPLHFRAESTFCWEERFADLVEACDRCPGREGGFSLLDETARRLFAGLTATLIQGGAIPCADVGEATVALREKPVAVFDFGTGRGEVASWFVESFEALLPSFSEAAASLYDLSVESALFWLGELFHYSRDAPGEPRGGERSRAAHLLEAAGKGAAEGHARRAFFELCGILSRETQIVFAVDHLDAHFGVAEKGRQISSQLVEIADGLPGGAVVLSVNEDLWRSIFAGALPGAVEDRLGMVRIELGGVSYTEAGHLVDERLRLAGIADDAKFRFLSVLGLDLLFENAATEPGEPVTVRAVLRHARRRWEGFVSGGFGAQSVEAGRAGTPSPEPMPVPEATGPDPFPVPHRQEPGEPEAEPRTTGGDRTGNPPERKGIEFISLTQQEAPPTLPKLEPLSFENLISLPPEEPPQGGGKGDRERAVSADEHHPEGTEETAGQQTQAFRPEAVELADVGVTSPDGLPELHPLLQRFAGELEEPDSIRSVDFPGLALEGERFLPSYYNRLRQEAIREIADGDLDLGRIREVIRAGGARFPAIVQRDLELPSQLVERGLRWSYENQDIVFGFEDLEYRAFWEEFLGCLRRTVGSERGEGGGGLKLVLFLGEGKRFGFDEWKRFHGVGGNDRIAVDLVWIDAETAGGIYAGNHLLEDMRTGRIRQSEAQVLGFLARELDYFWRRLTRSRI
ncbi:MAG: hypothetical protein ACC661_02710, partial [Verrucomicrobiales bacterium]